VKAALAIVAALLAIAGNVPYIWQVIKGTVRPHPYTWLVGCLVSATIFFGMLQKGAGIGALPTAASEIFTVAIFFLSLRYGFKKITRTDTVLLCIALLGIIPWLVTRDPTLSVVIAVTIDLIAFMPTIRKTWAAPRTEAPILYGMNVARHVLAIFSLQAYNIATTLHSVAMVLVNSLMVAIVALRRNKKGVL
jgi:hypothetical protein